MKVVPELSAVLEGLYDKPLLGPKPDQLLIFKRPQLAVKLEALMQPATSAAAKHANGNLINQVIAALYQNDELHDHVVGWAPVRAGQQNAEVHLCFKDASAQHRQQLAAAGSIQLTMHATAALVSLPVSTVASKQLPDVTMVRLHNVPGGMNVHGLMGSLLRHFQFGPDYSVVAEYGGDVSGDIAAVTPAWCRSDVCVAELRAPVQDPKLSRLPAAFTCFGQQVSVSVQPSILAKAHMYRQRCHQQNELQSQPASVSAAVLSPRSKRRKAQRARAQRSAAEPAQQMAGAVPAPLPALHDSFQPATSSDALPGPSRVALQRPLDPISDLGGQRGRAGLGHSQHEPMQVEQLQPVVAKVSVDLPVDIVLPNAPDLSRQPSASLPDSSAASAMLLWAEEYDVAAVSAKQAVLYLHEHHAQQLEQHGNGSCVSLPEPIQQLMVEAVRAVTQDSTFAVHEYPDSLASASELATGPSACPNSVQHDSAQQPRRSGRGHKPVSEYWRVPPAAPGGAQ